MKPLLNISTVERDRALRVVAAGELDLSTVALLAQALLAAQASAAARIVLDIEAVSFIDSTGLGALLEAHARSQEDGNRLQITRGSAQAQRLFALAGADERLPFTDA